MKFDKASTGIQGLDQIINYLRIGDNVVWQVDHLADYVYYVNAFVKQSIKDNRKIIYMRFGTHEPLLEESPHITVYPLNPSVGFESFTIEVHQIVKQEGLEAFYIFDSLSTLLESWATDLMIGNFFQVTCPYLYQMETIAYFAIIRDNHSFSTIARIRETTQLLLNLHNIDHEIYIHPLKVFNRYSATMFLPHTVSGDEILPITSSAKAAALFQYLPERGLGNAKRQLDYWDKLFLEAESLTNDQLLTEAVRKNQKQEMLTLLCLLMIGKEPRILEMSKAHFTLEDLITIKSRLIGSGYIGGKTVGMLLARQMLKHDNSKEWETILEPHDSFYIGSDVFYTYLVQNGWWHLRLHQRSSEGYFEAATILRKEMWNGVFPEHIKEQFVQMLEYYGQSPIIVRSSSLLEDSFGNAFSGKYDSVFCVNQGTPAERYKQFEQAIKTVYVSAMSQDALAYRMKRGLDQKDEQMAILVQRVSGDYYKKYFFPFLAGVGFSYNNYVWKDILDPHAGMIRLVFGLGTKAVDRVTEDYPRVAALDHPTLQPLGSDDEKRKYSQLNVDVLDLEDNTFKSISLYRLMWEKPEIHMDTIGVLDYKTNQRIKEFGIQGQEAWTLTYEKLFKQTNFIETMKCMLSTLEKSYHYPVDVEFTANTVNGQDLTFNLVQCRPLQTKGNVLEVTMPTVNAEQVLFKTEGHFMGGSMDQQIHRILYVDPKAYSALSNQDKYGLANIIGKLNKILHQPQDEVNNDEISNSINFAINDSFIKVMLIAPGRIGSSTPSLGIPINFSEISNMNILCETAYEIMGMMPDLSYGSHFFQDLIENNIFYVSIFPGANETFMNEDFFMHTHNSLLQWLPDAHKFEDVLKVIETNDVKITAQVKTQQLICYKTI